MFSCSAPLQCVSFQFGSLWGRNTPLWSPRHTQPHRSDLSFDLFVVLCSFQECSGNPGAISSSINRAVGAFGEVIEPLSISSSSSSIAKCTPKLCKCNEHAVNSRSVAMRLLPQFLRPYVWHTHLHQGFFNRILIVIFVFQRLDQGCPGGRVQSLDLGIRKTTYCDSYNNICFHEKVQNYKFLDFHVWFENHFE